MPGRARGFTLIEVLVSIVIVGILISVAVVTLSLASDDRALREEARRFMTLMDVVQDEAMMQGRDFGIEDDELRSLWPAVEARHLDLFPADWAWPRCRGQSVFAIGPGHPLCTHHCWLARISTGKGEDALLASRDASEVDRDWIEAFCGDGTLI